MGPVAISIKPSAVLWDFDGTMVNTEVVWIASEIAVMSRYGVQWTYEQGAAGCGSAASDAIRMLLGEAARQLGEPLDVEPDAFWAEVAGNVQHHLETQGPPWLPGARELLTELSDAGVPMALVSSSPPDLLNAGLQHMPRGLFATVVSGPEMPRGKPAPDSYLMAAERLGVEAADCVVIEDSLPGTAAGRASGAVVVAVPCMHPLPTAAGQVNLESLAGLTRVGLSQIWHEVRSGA